MKVGICSDSHDHVRNLRYALETFKRQGVEAIIHAGDFVAPFVVEVLREADVPVYGVFGNCDGERRGLAAQFEGVGELYREPHIFEIGGKRFVVMHHPEWVEAFRHAELADVIVHGHTHELRIEEGSPVIINPGEVYGGRSLNGPTVVVYNTETGRAELFKLG